VKRGEIWWARMPGPARSRPVLLLSRDEAYAKRTQITIAPLTRRIRELPVEVLVGRADGLPSESAVNLDNINTIDKVALDNRITQLSPQKMAAVDSAIKFALDLT
jgi:mRNA interferase MazF